MECPFCKQRMQLKQLEGVKVDVCDEHGIWLDKGEIEALMDSAKQKGHADGLTSGLWNVSHGY